MNLSFLVTIKNILIRLRMIALVVLIIIKQCRFVFSSFTRKSNQVISFYCSIHSKNAQDV